jgi:hypothetical protein
MVDFVVGKSTFNDSAFVSCKVDDNCSVDSFVYDCDGFPEHMDYRSLKRSDKVYYDIYDVCENYREELVDCVLDALITNDYSFCNGYLVYVVDY